MEALKEKKIKFLNSFFSPFNKRGLGRRQPVVFPQHFIDVKALGHKLSLSFYGNSIICERIQTYGKLMLFKITQLGSSGVRI